MKSKRIIFTVIFAFIAFIIGFYNYPTIQALFLSFVPEIKLQYKTVYAIMYQSIFFGIVLALFPILLHVLWKKFTIQSFMAQFSILGIFILTATAAIIFRNFQLKMISKIPFTSTVIAQPGDVIETNTSFYDVEKLDYPLFILIAQIITFFIIYIILKKRKPKH